MSALSETELPRLTYQAAYNEVAKEYEGKVKVGKVNVDEEQELAVRYGIASIPTVILFKNGAIANKTIGFGSKAQITDMLK